VEKAGSSNSFGNLKPSKIKFSHRNADPNSINSRCLLQARLYAHWRLGGSGFLPPILVGPHEEQPLGDEGGELGSACLRRLHRPGLGTLRHGLRDPGAGAGAVE
jgi:hypothetical protein